MQVYSKVRETGTGVEWWNNNLKRTEVFPKGVDPNRPRTIIIAEQTEPPVEPSIDEMDIDQLREHAEENGIDIPGNMKKLETIRQHVIEELNAAVDASVVDSSDVDAADTNNQ